jgi:hypothetical protein
MEELSFHAHLLILAQEMEEVWSQEQDFLLKIPNLFNSILLEFMEPAA